MRSSEFYEFLVGSVEDSGERSREAVVALIRENTDIELTAPGILALACWGKIGLEAVKQIALDQGSSKKTSSALKLFSLLSCGTRIEPLTFFVLDEIFSKLVNENIAKNKNIKSDAKSVLYSLLLSMDNNDLLIPLGVAFTQISMANSEAAEQLVAALSVRWLKFGPSTLDEFRTLIRTSPQDEPAFQAFLESHCQFLDPMAKRVWSQPDLHGQLEPDFVLQRADNSYLVIEIECPSKTIVTKGNQLSADATHAEVQVSMYREFLIERMQQSRAQFPNFRDPDYLVVIGTEDRLSDSQRKALQRANDARHRCKIVGFDYLADRAEAIMANASQGEIELISRFRFL